MALFRIPSDVMGIRKFKMAAAKPEILISQLLNQIETRRSNGYTQTHVFGVKELNGASVDVGRCNRKAEKIQDGGR